MGTNTPALDYGEKENYLKTHLFNELRWLLCAATEWSIQDQLNLRQVGYDIQVYAMDSAVLHARVLFEFFVQATTNNHYGSNEFLALGAVLTSSSYDNWRGPLHSFLMHAQDRSNPVPLIGSSGVSKDLNQMPVDFAHEILKLWKEFERMLDASSIPRRQELKGIAREKRKEAIEAAQCAVNSTVAQQHAKEKGQLLKPVFVFE